MTKLSSTSGSTSLLLPHAPASKHSHNPSASGFNQTQTSVMIHYYPGN